MTHTKGNWEIQDELETKNLELLISMRKIARLLKHQLGGSGEKAHKIAVEAIKNAEG